MGALPPDVGTSGPDARLLRVRPVLTLLTQQPVLIAVTVQVTVADAMYEITVSKAVDEAGTVLPRYWWEVDKLTEDEQGQHHREKRWQLDHRVYETAEAAYLAAEEWVQTQAATAQ